MTVISCGATSTSVRETTTARPHVFYEDIGVITCDPDIGADAAQLFNHLTGYSRAHDYSTLLVAPRDLRRQLLDLIEHEASFGVDGEIVMKCNSIADEEMVEALYAERAQQAYGSTYSCVASAVCEPGVPGMSENIRVRSILGRYLEHSRIYRFKHGNVVVNGRLPGAERSMVYLIGSADLMPRNLNRRVEVLVPIETRSTPCLARPGHRLPTRRGIVCWELQPDDTWQAHGSASDVFEPHPQEQMYRWAVDRQTPSRAADASSTSATDRRSWSR